MIGSEHLMVMFVLEQDNGVTVEVKMLVMFLFLEMKVVSLL